MTEGLKKISLDLDALEVESFDTSPQQRPGKGTVEGYDTLLCQTLDPSCTCEESCDIQTCEVTCVSCFATECQSCGFTCNPAVCTNGGTCYFTCDDPTCSGC